MKNRSAISVLCVTILVLVSMFSFQFGAAFADDMGNIDTGQHPVGGTAPITITPQCGTILLIEGPVSDPGQGGGSAALDAFGYTYTLASTAQQVAAANFSQYKVIFVAWGQDDVIANALIARSADLASWINAGGGIVVNAQGGTGAYAFLPVQLTSTVGCGESIVIVDPTHPLANGLTGALLSDWNYSNHINITAWPACAARVARCASSPNGAHILGMTYGNGEIIVTGTDPEWHVAYGTNNIGAWQLLYNELSWACSIHCPTVTSVDPNVAILGSAPTVKIKGSNFGCGTAVSFGDGISVNSFTVDSFTQITAVIEIRGAGLRDVKVTAAGCTGTLANGFTALPPSVDVGSSGYVALASATGPYIPPAFEVQNATVAATKAAPGEQVEVNAMVTNKGGSNGTTKIILYVNGQEADSKGIALSSGQSAPISFKVSRNDPGTYQVYVNGVSAGSFTVDLFNGNDMLIYCSIALFVIAMIGLLYYIMKRRTSA